MTRSIRLPAVVAAVALLPGCGDKPAPVKPKEPVVTVWSSFPHRGPQRKQALLSERALRGAIHDLRALTKGYRVRYVALDDSSAQADGWDPAIVAANARRASANPGTLAYLGDYDSGATAVALPILNQVGVLQLSPSSTAEGLTLPGVGAGPGAPYQYYPSGRRTLARLVAHDSLQGAVIAATARADRCRSLAIVDDGSIYGAGLAEIVASEASPRRIRVRMVGSLDPRSGDYRARVRKVRAGCILYSGEPGAAAVRVVTDVARRNRKSRLYGPDALVTPAFADRRQGGLSPSLAKRVSLIASVVPGGRLTPLGRTVTDNLGGFPGAVQATYVANSYAAAELALRCIDWTFEKTRFAAARVAESRRLMIACAIGRRHRSAALGDYRIDGNGDWSLRSFARFRIVDGRVVVAGALKSPRLVASPTPADQASG